ncbi:hypothetical protein EYZ11_012650 [Aspergillus tanneri]|uniref:Major facilitator superfamily (MFS) profile domain-containing protein n=1 Tax=Aspergillus tanneri TaxID=1220188 RepID=A0A4V3UMM6_9EURO|nr:uncharacterized protein ATNIH1004_011743 [Aspergillus tanneri]KAA8641607.1 hypothetical protein ATNIH1004_011743 [Aspergillus tanneri]THC87904.1 hypothetical protein EYZ11_012650 [Aspergillus tanneri]
MGIEYVEFTDPNDPLNPLNWPLAKKVYTLALLGVAALTVIIASSIFFATIPDVMVLFGVGREVGMLGISLYVLGFAFGPLCWVPFSELHGRRTPLVVSMVGFTVFIFVIGLAPSLSVLLIFRYCAGLFGAGPLTLAGATLADLSSFPKRAAIVANFCVTTFISTLVAPFIGGFIVMDAALGWRWTAFLPAILGGAISLLLMTTFHETYPPIILVSKAGRLRHKSGIGEQSQLIIAEHEVSVNIRSLLDTYLSLPFKMLAFDPIVLGMSIFGSFMYGLLYWLLTAYYVIFQQIRGMNPGTGALPYIAIVVGQFFGALAVLAFQPWFSRKLKQKNKAMAPEWHLPIAIPGAISLAAGLLWLGWSGYDHTFSWIMPTTSGFFTGFGQLTMFLPSISYLIDTHPTRAASALAAHAFLSSIAGAAFPLFSVSMFETLGAEWACTLLGCVGILLASIPLIFYLYGDRARNKFYQYS